MRPKLWLPLAAGVLLLIARLLPLPQNGALFGLPPLCPLKALTTWPCPGCGLTRAIVLCAHGQWKAAFEFHPLGPIVYGFLLLLFCAGVLLLFRRNRHHNISPLFLQRAAYVAGFSFVAALTTTWILRLLHVLPFPVNF